MPKQCDHSDHKPLMEYNQITDLIWLGSDSCCDLHFDEGLLRQGIRADISLQDERIDQPTGVDYFLWLPTPDTTAPAQTKLEVGVAAMEKFIQNKVKMYIHCTNGHGRAPSLLAAYFIAQGDTVEQAIERIAAQRPEIHPNEAQRAGLAAFATSLDKN